MATITSLLVIVATAAPATPLEPWDGQFNPRARLDPTQVAIRV